VILDYIKWLRKMSKKIAVIGDEEAVFLFKLVGVLDSFTAKDGGMARDLLRKLAETGDYALVILTQNLADEMGREFEELAAKFKNLAVITLPGRIGPSLKKADVLREIIRRAIGFEVFVR
jgi:vacuolar-type H+-ATPase subunit F/Vma7